jgi:hypothetical protein
MKSSTAAALILCTLLVCATVLVCTGHGVVVADAVWAVVILFFFLVL